MAAPKHYAVNAWHMEFTEGTSNKFYQVFVSESGLTVLRWGRIGAAGQHSVARYDTYDEARDQGLKQVYAKKSKGYVQKYGDRQFMATVEALNYAQRDNPTMLASEFHTSLDDGAFEGAKITVIRQYRDFAETVKDLMDRAGSTTDFGASMDEYQQLEKVWEEITDVHAEVSAAMSIAQATLFQKLMA